jgi:hypothetical protein
LIIAFDRHALRDLHTISDRLRTSPSLPQRLVSSLSPLSAFETKYKIEDELKEIYLRTTNQMSNHLPSLIRDVSHLCYLLRRINDIQGNIRGLTLDERKNTSEIGILGQLWDILARSDNFAQLKSQQTLLNDLTTYYATASKMMNESLHALTLIRSNLKELPHVHASSVLAWRDVPLEMTIDNLSRAMKRLEDGRQRVDGMERGQQSTPLTNAYATVLASRPLAT